MLRNDLLLRHGCVSSNDCIESQPHRRGSVIGFILSVHIRMNRNKLEKSHCDQTRIRFIYLKNQFTGGAHHSRNKGRLASVQLLEYCCSVSYPSLECVPMDQYAALRALIKPALVSD